MAADSKQPEEETVNLRKVRDSEIEGANIDRTIWEFSKYQSNHRFTLNFRQGNRLILEDVLIYFFLLQHHFVQYSRFQVLLPTEAISQPLFAVLILSQFSDVLVHFVIFQKNELSLPLCLRDSTKRLSSHFHL